MPRTLFSSKILKYMANWLSYLFVWPQCAHFIILRPSSWWIKKIRNQRSQKVLKNVSVDCVFRPRSRWKGNHTNNNGWKCFPSCVISPFWPSIHNPNTIKAVLIAYLGQGADEKATIQTIFFGNASMVADLVPFDLVNTIQIQSKRFCWLRI